MKNTRIFGLAAVTMALGLTGIAQAQLEGWRLNEVVVRTNDGTAADRSQFIELYHPVADQSVDGLSIVVIRPFFTDGAVSTLRYEYGVELSGTADGNFFLIGNQNYADNFGDQDLAANPDDSWIMRPGGTTQGSYQEILLVPTADIDPGWPEPGTSVGAGGKTFDGSEFDNGNNIIDSVYLVGNAAIDNDDESTVFTSMDPADPQKYIANPDFATAGPIGGQRLPDGTGDWVAYSSDEHIDPDGPETQQLPSASTPGASNSATSVNEWRMYY